MGRLDLPDPFRDEDLIRHTPEIQALYSEDGDIVWFPYELAPNHGKARYLAWAGPLPWNFKEGGCRLIDLRVRVRWMRDISRDVEPPALFFDEDRPWHVCNKDAPNAVKMWQVSC